MFNNMTYEEVYDKYIQPQKVQAYKEGYEQGRHDMEREINALGECEYNKGRADAIDECIAKITNEHTHSCYNDDVYECVKLLEQLKDSK